MPRADGYPAGWNTTTMSSPSPEMGRQEFFHGIEKHRLIDLPSCVGT